MSLWSYQFKVNHYGHLLQSQQIGENLLPRVKLEENLALLCQSNCGQKEG